MLERTRLICTTENWFIGDFCLITVPKLYLGGDCQINAGTKILGRESVSVGGETVVSYDCLLLTSSDTPNPKEWRHNDFAPENERRVASASITVGSRCFIGAKSILMPGVVIPDETVIPAGSYVSMNKNGELKVRSVYHTNCMLAALYGTLKRKRILRGELPSQMYQ